MVLLTIQNVLVVAAYLFLLAAFCAVAWVYQRAYYNSYFYDLSSEGLVIRKGVFSSKKTIIPLSKMQDVYVDQDILDRVMGLYDLHISSASDVSGFEAHIDGIIQEYGAAMKELFLSGAGVSSSKGASGEPIPLSGSGMLLALIRPVLGIAIIALFAFPLGLLFLLLLPVLLVFSYLDYKSLRYELRESGVFIRRGFFQPKESLFLYRNIQDVEVSSDLWSMIFGMRSLAMKTMTSLSARDARMDYLSEEDANRLRDDILKRARNSSHAKAAGKEQAATGPAQTLQELSEGMEAPYANNILKSSLYSGMVIWIPLLLIAIATVAFFGLSAILAIAPFLILVLLVVAGGAVNVITLLVSYEYRMSPQYVSIKNGIFNVASRRIDYRKVQDLVLNISFPQSFAGLGSIRLETGSKEIIPQGRTQSVASRSIMVEAIPDLTQDDAEALKKRIASYMGLSLAGIGKDPLVKRLPLERIKPFKKTLWWFIFLTPVLVITLLLPFSGLDLAKALAAVLYAVFMAAKYVYETYYYRRYFYDVNDQVLVIKKGVFGSKEIIIPFTKIQDVFISQDILDRAFGLRDVYVSTVSGRSILNAHIDGVNVENAEKTALLILEGIRKN